jgi:phosphatidate cytidylyltransferase
MLSDPLVHPLLWPTVQRVGGLLAAILLLIVLVDGRHGRALLRRPLFQKWCSWAIIAPVYTLAVLGGALPTALLALAISLQGLREYATLTSLPPAYRRGLLALGALAAPAALVSPAFFFALPPLLLVLGTISLFQPGQHDGVRHLGLAIFGWGYLALLPALLVLLHHDAAGGPGLLLAVGLAVALGDVGAYTAGTLLGRRPLAPHLSPSKTWEGAAGGLVGALLGLGMMSVAWPAAQPLVPAGLLWALVIGLGCVWGDLVESAIKRAGDAKDAGTWLPGFGGLLDRVDSLVLVLPLVYYGVQAGRLFA